SILLYAGGHPVFLVDAYTIRIGRRIGLFDTNAYDDVQKHFETRVPRDLAMYREYHALLVAHAKALCRPTPSCNECPSALCATSGGDGSDKVRRDDGTSSWYGQSPSMRWHGHRRG